MSFDFSRIKYRRPWHGVTTREITDLIGFDSEAYTDGVPFMFCLSDGTCLDPAEFPAALFARRYRNRHFMVWNLRYEAGAVLRELPQELLEELRSTTTAGWEGYRITYYPHKFLRFAKGRNAITFWDGAGFYQSSLEAAASKYLGEHKGEMETKRFTRAFVREHFERIKAYCVQDADLTRKLGLYLLRYLNGFGVHPAALYSQASIAFQYFKQEAGIVDVWPYWQKKKRLLYFACMAYAGGKFEMTRRGAFEGHCYDISSAYPRELADLPDLRDAEVSHSTELDPEAHFGFVHAALDLNRAVHHSVPFKVGGVNTYPSGSFTAYLTKRELEYLLARGVRVKVLEGYWIRCTRPGFPYRSVVMKLWDLKESVGEDDVMKYDLSKKILNGFYGKAVQLTELPDGTLRAGPGWNPIYGATITANVRLRMAAAQELLGRDCYAVHTDSVLATSRLPASMLGPELGGWKLKRSGKGVMIACGVYELAGKSANRGFEMRDGFNWTEQLLKAGDARKVSLTEHRPLSWAQAAQQKRRWRINEFMDFPKVLDLNADVKRVWPLPASARALLETVQDSAQRVVLGTP